MVAPVLPAGMFCSSPGITGGTHSISDHGRKRLVRQSEIDGQAFHTQDWTGQTQHLNLS